MTNQMSPKTLLVQVACCLKSSDDGQSGVVIASIRDVTWRNKIENGDELRISRHDQALAADACKTKAELPADMATLRNRPTELEWVEGCKREGVASRHY